MQGQQLAEKVQQKLQSDSASIGAVAAAPADAESALAVNEQLHTDHHSDRRHHKGSHAHFAEESNSALEDADGDSITGRNESITAVRGGVAGTSRAEGTFWKGLDAEGSYRAVPGMVFATIAPSQDMRLYIQDHPAYLSVLRQ